MEQNTQKAKTAALLEAFGCALAYLLAGKLLATVLPAPAGDARALSFAQHCVLAPVAEELVFRGAVQRLAQPLGRRKALALQAVLFALQHGSPAAAWALVCGLGLGWLADRTGRVWPGMLLHTLNNLLVFAAG